MNMVDVASDFWWWYDYLKINRRVASVLVHKSTRMEVATRLPFFVDVIENTANDTDELPPEE